MVLWQQKMDDLENRMQINNIRIVGMPEKVEGLNVGQFVERWIKTIFPDAEFSMAFEVERAHRVPARSPNQVHQQDHY